MNFNVPDKLYKLSVAVGVLLIFFSVQKLESFEDEYFHHQNSYNQLIDSVEIINLYIDNKISNLKIESGIFQSYYDSTSNTVDILSKYSSEQINTEFDKIKKENVNINNLIFKDRILKKKIEQEDVNLTFYKSYYDDGKENYMIFLFLGIGITFLGVLVWLDDNPKNKNNRCQSCGRNFSAMVKHGTEKNKTLNDYFCLSCYKKGKFTKPNLTKEEALLKFKNHIKGNDWLKRKLMMSIFKNLDRWK